MRVKRAFVFAAWLVYFAVQSLWPAPKLGPPEPAPRCEIPIETAGLGVRCLSAGAARVRGLMPGDRIGSGPSRMAPARLAAWSVPIDINRGAPEELASLDGIGPRLAERIVRARPFESVEAVARVPGIGARKMAILRPRLMR